ncbi:MAG: hypothetical protein ACPG4Q_03440 [Phycisphaeraceae bacterium]
MNSRLMIFLSATAIALGLFTNQSYAQAAAIPEDFRQQVEKQGWSQERHDALYAHKDEAIGAAMRKLMRAKRDEQALKSGLVVHEWGSMQHHLGSSMSEFDLIGEDQSDLPSFVKVWADQPVMVPQVIRKPILYFYTQQQQKVNVTVRFPEGVLTQWYPDVAHFSPQRNDRGRRVPNQNALQKNGTLAWRQIELNPETDTSKFAKVDANHPWWHTARETDATPIHVPNQRRPGAQRDEAVERFLFYRGAGTYTPMVLPKRDKAGEDLSVTVPFSQIDLRGVFLVRVNDSGATITHAPILRAENTLVLAGPEAIQPIQIAAKTAKAQLIDSLEAAGLFSKEAEGLVKIWGDDMFTSPGERLLYIMPSNEVERLLPLDIQPAPSQTVRTLIAWVELSTPQLEKRIMDLVKQLGSEAWAERQAADKELRRCDRFGEAILRRALDATEDPEIRMRVEQILASLEQERQQGKEPKRP